MPSSLEPENEAAELAKERRQRSLRQQRSLVTHRSIQNILKSIEPKAVQLTKEAVAVLMDFSWDMFKRILRESIALCNKDQRRQLNARTIQASVRLVLKHDLARYAISESTKALSKWYNNKRNFGNEDAKQPTSNSKRAGLVVAISKVKTQMSKLAKRRLAYPACIYMAATLEYLLAELIEISMNVAKADSARSLSVLFTVHRLSLIKAMQKHRVTCDHIALAVANDDDFWRVVGFRTTIHNILLSRGTSKRAETIFASNNSLDSTKSIHPKPKQSETESQLDFSGIWMPAAGDTFPQDYKILAFQILQWTDLSTSTNKYFALEVHEATDPSNDEDCWRIYAHHGSLAALLTMKNGGKREVRHLQSQKEAMDLFQVIVREKTSNPSKGYKTIDMAASSIGSAKLQQLLGALTTTRPFVPVTKVAELSLEVRQLVDYIYSEAKSALTKNIAASITDRGIETPLGVLTLQQVQIGESILMQIYEHIENNTLGTYGRAISSFGVPQTIGEELSGQFYSTIPHNIGLSAYDRDRAVIRTTQQVGEKQELLQLMRDLLSANHSGGLGDATDNKYAALKNKITHVSQGSAHYETVSSLIHDSSPSTEIVNIFALHRELEANSFALASRQVGGVRQLFHGSSISNWVGILMRGLLLPKIVVDRGGGRTDAGNLGNGLYFGSEASTSLKYTTPGAKGTRILLVCDVSLGNSKQCYEYIRGINAPPSGFDSLHGVSRLSAYSSDFVDNEFVVFNSHQHKQSYLVECK